MERASRGACSLAHRDITRWELIATYNVVSPLVVDWLKSQAALAKKAERADEKDSPTDEGVCEEPKRSCPPCNTPPTPAAEHPRLPALPAGSISPTRTSPLPSFASTPPTSPLQLFPTRTEPPPPASPQPIHPSHTNDSDAVDTEGCAAAAPAASTASQSLLGAAVSTSSAIPPSTRSSAPPDPLHGDNPPRAPPRELFTPLSSRIAAHLDQLVKNTSIPLSVAPILGDGNCALTSYLYGLHSQQPAPADARELRDSLRQHVLKDWAGGRWEKDIPASLRGHDNCHTREQYIATFLSEPTRHLDRTIFYLLQSLRLAERGSVEGGEEARQPVPHVYLIVSDSMPPWPVGNAAAARAAADSDHGGAAGSEADDAVHVLRVDTQPTVTRVPGSTNAQHAMVIVLEHQHYSPLCVASQVGPPVTLHALDSPLVQACDLGMRQSVQRSFPEGHLFTVDEVRTMPHVFPRLVQYYDNCIKREKPIKCVIHIRRHKSCDEKNGPCHEGPMSWSALEKAEQSRCQDQHRDQRKHVVEQPLKTNKRALQPQALEASPQPLKKKKKKSRTKADQSTALRPPAANGGEEAPDATTDCNGMAALITLCIDQGPMEVVSAEQLA